METKMEQFPATNPNPVLNAGKDGTILYSNVAGEPLLHEWGMSVGEKLPLHIEKIVHRAISLNSPEKMEVKVRNRVYLVSFHPLPEEECVNIYGFDISEQKELEVKLRESEEQYRAFFENSIDAVFLTSPDGNIYAANPEACRIFGMTEDEIIRAGRKGVVDTSDPRLPIVLEERDRTGKFKGELNHKRKDGTIFPAEVSTLFFTDRNGAVKTSTFIRDITERKRAEKARVKRMRIFRCNLRSCRLSPRRFRHKTKSSRCNQRNSVELMKLCWRVKCVIECYSTKAWMQLF